MKNDVKKSWRDDWRLGNCIRGLSRSLIVVAWVFHGEREGSWFDLLRVEIGIKCRLRSMVVKFEEEVNFDLTNLTCRVKKLEIYCWEKSNVDTWIGQVRTPVASISSRRIAAEWGWLYCKLVIMSLFEVVLYLICNTLAIFVHVGKAVKTSFASDDS